MKRAWILAAIWALSLCAAEPLSVPLRGRTQTLVRIDPRGPRNAAVIFLPGDGGWRGAAITMGEAMASWGYEVYGFDTKKYLEDRTVSRDQMTSDLRELAARVRQTAGKPVVLAGWSQGAGMAIAAASGTPPQGLIQGVLTLGLPESAVLGWDWKATIAVLARRTPDQPAFSVAPLLAGVSPTPLWMIHGSNDEYSGPGTARALFAAAAEPKHFEEIASANHRFDGHSDELYRSMQAGLRWITGRP